MRRDPLEQARLYAAQTSKAKTLADTPHGRGAAVDLYPVLAFDDLGRPSAVDLYSRERFAELGAAAKRFGLVWGGEFSGLYDGPHVELAEWRALPFPPLA
jgi:hypothetical protein